MKAGAMICGVLVMVLSVAWIAYTLRHWHPSKRHVVAGATSLFFMGALIAFNVTDATAHR